MRHIAAIAAFILSAALPASAQAKDWNVGGKVGLGFEGDVNVDPPDRDVDGGDGLLFQGDIDTELAPQLLGGGRMRLGFPEMGSDTEFLFAAGPTVKAAFKPAPKLSLRPGLALMLQRVSGAGRTNDSAYGMGLDLFLEAGTPISSDLEFTGEFGFNFQPVGGTGDVDVTWGPLFYLMVGVRY